MKFVEMEPLLSEKIWDENLSIRESAIFPIQIKSLHQHNKGGKNEFMSFEDLKLVKKLMSLDLTNIINWDKSAEDSHIYPTPTPYHQEAFN